MTSKKITPTAETAYQKAAKHHFGEYAYVSKGDGR